jgi:dolichol kinase
MAESAVDLVFGRLLFRKAYHLLAGTLILTAIPLLDPPVFTAFLVFYLVAFRVWGKRISFAVLGILIVSLFCSKYITFGATLIFVIGDGLAGLVGSYFGRTRWPWSAQKTVEGSLAFFLSAILAMLLFLSLTMTWTTDLLLLAGLPTLAGCIAEVLPIDFIRDRRPDDNLIVILTSGIALQGLTLWLNAYPV